MRYEDITFRCHNESFLQSVGVPGGLDHLTTKLDCLQVKYDVSQVKI